MVRRLRLWLPRLLAALVLVLAVLALSPEPPVGYLARQAFFQGELLWGRVPLEAYAAREDLPDDTRLRLSWIGPINAFGDELGLAAGKSYDTINPTWRRTIYNVSASDPVAFRPVRWTFPIVGSVPYLGYFRVEDARRRGRALSRRGLDVYIRTAGAYSTLGWFRDPVLPHMLRWSEGALANTLMHERTHGTLWIPGSVKFNESFASFVGREAELRYLAYRFGEHSDELTEELQRREDSQRWRALMHDTYTQLKQIYDDPGRDRGAKLRDKQIVLAGLPVRVARARFHSPAPYLRAARRGPWNNARLVQFRTYNASESDFDLVLSQEGGDLRRFIDRIGTLTHRAADPYEALRRAAHPE